MLIQAIFIGGKKSVQSDDFLKRELSALEEHLDRCVKTRLDLEKQLLRWAFQPEVSEPSKVHMEAPLTQNETSMKEREKKCVCVVSTPSSLKDERTGMHRRPPRVSSEAARRRRKIQCYMRGR